MHRLALTAAALTLLASGCGSGPGGSGTTSASTASKSAEPAYFQQAESDVLNEAAAPAMKAAGAASSAENIKRCNRIQLYPAWRRCWHKLLDPLAGRLTRLSAAFIGLSGQSFPQKCVTQLEGAARTFTSFSETITALLAGYDSTRATARSKAANSYGSSLDQVTSGFQKPFQTVTQGCYSPKVLASLKASPSPSASPSR